MTLTCECWRRLPNVNLGVPLEDAAWVYLEPRTRGGIREEEGGFGRMSSVYISNTNKFRSPFCRFRLRACLRHWAYHEAKEASLCVLPEFATQFSCQCSVSDARGTVCIYFSGVFRCTRGTEELVHRAYTLASRRN